MVSCVKVAAIAVSLVFAGSTVLVSSPAHAAPVQVFTWADLQGAFTGAALGSETTVQLSADITAGPASFLTVPDNGGSGGAQVILDLNGHHLGIPANPDQYAGIAVFLGASLTIEDTASGGVLDVTGGDYAAAIGVSYAQNNDIALSSHNHGGGSIIIDSGTVNATGGAEGGGIGGAYYIGGGSITINGGTVTAQGAGGATGIGNGYVEDSSYGSTAATSILITGGSIAAYGGSGVFPGEGGGPGIGLAPQTDPLIDVMPTIAISGCANVIAFGGTGAAAGGGAGIGAGSSNLATPALTIDGLAPAGAPTVAGSGADFDGVNTTGTALGGLGSAVTYSGLATNVLAVSASTPATVSAGGLFSLTCTVVAAAPATIPVVPALAATGSNDLGIAGLAGILALMGIVAFALTRRLARG